MRSLTSSSSTHLREQPEGSAGGAAVARGARLDCANLGDSGFWVLRCVRERAFACVCVCVCGWVCGCVGVCMHAWGHLRMKECVFYCRMCSVTTDGVL